MTCLPGICHDNTPSSDRVGLMTKVSTAKAIDVVAASISFLLSVSLWFSGSKGQLL
jgi:hypothetical protein